MYHSFLLNMPLGSIIQFFAQNNELISRNFQAFYSLDGEYELVDLDYEEAHRVSRETIEILNSYNFKSLIDLLKCLFFNIPFIFKSSIVI